MIQYDFDSIRARMIRDLQSKTSWAQILPSGTNTRIIDIVADALAEAYRYDEYLTRENKWALAQNRSSLIYQSDILGYTPKRKVAASGEVRLATTEEAVAQTTLTWDEETNYFTGDRVAYDGRIYEAIADSEGDEPDDTPTSWSRVTGLTHSNNIPISKYSLFSNGGDIVVTCTQDVNLLSTEDYVDVPVAEGTLKKEERTALGNVYEEFQIDNDGIAESHYELYVNDVEWSQVDDLRLADGDDEVYEIINLPDSSGITLRFGNDIFGKKLSNGDDIEFRFIETNGIEGNITALGVIDNVVTNLKDDTDTAVDTFCINENSIGGGKAIEDIETIRTNGPRIFQTGGRATSVNDYIAIIEDFSYVSRAIVWGEYEYNIDNNNPPGTFIELEENVVHIAAFTTAGEPLNNSQRDEIREYLNQFKSPTDILKFEDIEFVNLVFVVTAYVRDRSYTLTRVENNVVSALSEEYDVNNREFADNIYESDYKAFIDSVEGVDHHTTYVELFREIAFTSGYATSMTFSVYPVSPGTIEIYVRDDTESSPEYVLVATDDGSGGFAGESGYDVSGSSVDYTFGTVTFQVDASEIDKFYENYTVKILWRAVDSNLELTKRAQIFSYADTEIETVYTARR